MSERTLKPLDTPLAGTHLIEASAGTGKTYTITTLLLRLLLEQGRTIDQVLVVTFTRAATAELRDRVRERLRAARAAFADPAVKSEDALLAAIVARVDAAEGLARTTRALQSFDQANISTIHGFCQRMLQENAFESGAPFRTELVGDDRALRREVLQDWWARTLHDAPEALVRHLTRAWPVARLGKLVDKAVGAPDAVIVPGREADALPDAAALEAAVATFEAAWSQTAAIWAEAEAQVRRIILEQKVLHGGSYRADRLEGYLDALGEGLSGESRALTSKEVAPFERFAASTLAAKTKTGDPPRHPLFDAMDALLEANGALVLGLEEAGQRLVVDLVHEAREEVVRRKREQGVWSFDDLLVQLRDALREGPECALARAIRRRLPVALIDEFQDTDPVQYAVFRTVWAGRADTSLFLIGDPKQAIYAFRGADIFAYLAARGDAAEHTWTMKTNWRSDPGVLAAVQAVFQRGTDPFVLPAIPFVEVDARPGAEDRRADGAPALVVNFLEREGRTGRGGYKNSIINEHARLPERVAWRVLAILRGAVRLLDKQGAERPVREGQIAVLVRTGDQARAVQAALRAVRVPSVLQTDESVFGAPCAGWLRALLRAVSDPGDTRGVRTALATPLWGLSAAAILALQRDEAGWEAALARLKTWRELWTERGFMAAFRRMLSDLGATGRVLSWPGGERTMTDLLHLAELLQAAATTGNRTPDALLRWFEDVVGDPNRRDEDEAARLRLESDAEAVQIVTMHKSKGLEYPVVLCPYLHGNGGLRADDAEALRYHDPAHGDRLTLDLRPADDADKAAALERGQLEAMAEGLRLLYVALTRARHRCEVFWLSTRDAAGSPLGYLLHPASTPGDRREATRARIAKLTDAQMLEELGALAASTGGELAVNILQDESPAPWVSGLEDPPALTARHPRRVGRGWSTASFSRLAAAGDGPAPARVAEDEARDHDERADAPVEAAAGARAPVPLDGFARGPRAGNLLHDVLEHADFQWPAGGEDLRRLTARQLRTYGQDAETWTTPLTAALQGVLETPMVDDVGLPRGGEPAPRLCDLARAERISEMEFILPVAHGGDARALTPGRLADALAAHPGPGLPPDYPEAVRRMRFREVQGWMRGFVDLVFTWRGRWYVVDYKSNHLGPRADDYGRAGMAHAMAHHHYILQYHLYCVALHRALQRRVEGYAAETHFGGVLYLFLRGMAPGHAPGTGVFGDRPPPALLEALSRVLAGEAP